MAGRLLDGRGVVVPAALLAPALGWAAAQRPVAALAAAAALTAIAYLAVRVGALLLVLVAALPWEDALAWPTAQVTVVKLLGIGLFAAWALRALMRGERVRLHPLLVPIALLALAIVLALVVSPDPGAGVLDLRSYALFAAFLFLTTQIVRTRSDVRRVLAVTVIATAAAAGWGLFRVVALDAQRASGPIGDPNDFGFILACTLPFAAHLAANDRRHRRLWVACCALITAAVLATLSRGALAGLAGLAVWALCTRRIPLRALALGAGLLALTVALAAALWGPQLQQRLQSRQAIAEDNVASRLALWDGALRMAADRPLTGVGPGRFGIEAADYVHDDPLGIVKPVAHNTYLQALAETGILGLAALLAFLVAIWRTVGAVWCRACAAGDAEARSVAVAMQASLVTGLVAAAFLTEHFATPFWLAGGLAAALAAQRR